MSYQGKQATLPAGQGGFNASSNNTSIPITDLIQARNIRFNGDCWEKAPGMQTFDANGIAGDPDVIESFHYNAVQGLYRIVTAASDGSIYKEVGGDLDSVTLISGLTFVDSVSLVEAGEESFSTDKKLLMFSRNVAPHVLAADGATMTPLTDIPVDWTVGAFPLGAVYHDSRVVAFMQHQLYFSNLAAHDDFLTDDPPIISVAPGFSSEIICAFSYLPEQLYVWKYPFGIYRVDTTDITGLIVPVNTIKTDIGGAGPGAICRVKNDVWFVSSTGHIHSLTAVENSEDTTDSDITALLNLENWVRDNVDLSRLSSCKMLYHEERQEVWISYTSKTSINTINDLALVIDCSRPDQLRTAVEDRGEFFNTLFQYHDTDNSFKVFSGGLNGEVYECNTVARSINGVTPYAAVFEYPETDFSYTDPDAAHRFKRFDWLEVRAVPTGNYTLSFEIFIDGHLTQTVAVNLGQSGSALDSFILDTDRLFGGNTVKHKVKLYGRGRTISLRGTNTGNNENFIVTEIVIHYKNAQVEGTN